MKDIKPPDIFESSGSSDGSYREEEPSHCSSSELYDPDERVLKRHEVENKDEDVEVPAEAYELQQAQCEPLEDA